MTEENVSMFYVAKDTLLPDGKRLHGCPVGPARATLEQAERDLALLGGRAAGLFIGCWRACHETTNASLRELLEASKNDNAGDPPRWGQAA